MLYFGDLFNAYIDSFFPIIPGNESYDSQGFF